jgi:hypothetical protein
MKIKYDQEFNEEDKSEVVSKFCWLPTRCVDEAMNTSHYIVWLETVYWNKDYNSWSIIVPYNLRVFAQRGNYRR